MLNMLSKAIFYMSGRNLEKFSYFHSNYKNNKFGSWVMKKETLAWKMFSHVFLQASLNITPTKSGHNVLRSL